MWFSLYYFFGISRSAPLVNLELPLSFSVFRENLSREKIALKHTNDEAAHDDDSLARVTGFAEFDPRKTSQQSLPPQTGQGDGRRISARSRRPADPADSRQGLLGVQPGLTLPAAKVRPPGPRPRPHSHLANQLLPKGGATPVGLLPRNVHARSPCPSPPPPPPPLPLTQSQARTRKPSDPAAGLHRKYREVVGNGVRRPCTHARARTPWVYRISIYILLSVLRAANFTVGIIANG